MIKRYFLVLYFAAFSLHPLTFAQRVSENYPDDFPEYSSGIFAEDDFDAQNFRKQQFEDDSNLKARPQAEYGSSDSGYSGRDINPGVNLDGENKISLDIKGMDVVDVLKMLASRSGLNIVVGKNVTGRITLFIKSVEIWDAFDIILLSNDLAYEREGNIVNVMTQRDYELRYGERFQDTKETLNVPLKYAKAQDMARSLNQIKTNIGRVIADDASNTLILIDTPKKLSEMAEFIQTADQPIQTRVFELNYAQAEKIQAKIQESITKGVGAVKVDERTNKIAVTDYPAQLLEISKLIDAFDEKTPQVLIDAQIIEVKPTDKLEMGIDWGYWIKKHFTLSAAMTGGSDNSRLLLGTTDNTLARGGLEYKAIVDLLRTLGDTKVLSSPRIMALNNQEAKILIGTKEAYITSTTTSTDTAPVTSQSVNFVDVGLKLYVTPTINRDGYVTMKIKPEISEAKRTFITAEDKKTEIPIVTTSEAETTVMVKDGVTIIIGGLKKDKRDKTVKKIPVLGDIPGVGFLFRSTSDELTQSELVILLTPHIMSGDYPLTDLADIKPKDGAVAKWVKGEIVTEKISSGAGYAQKQADRIVTKHIEGFDKYESARQSTLEIYSQRLIGKIRDKAMFSAPAGERGIVKLAFTLIADGTLTDEPYVIKTNNFILGPFATKAIKDASPFEPFPESFAADKETFNVSLTYE